jgi:hypothetical protein
VNNEQENAVSGWRNPTMSHLYRSVSRWLAVAAMSVASSAAFGEKVQIVTSTPAAREERILWPELTLLVEGALPGTNPKLGQTIQLTLGRLQTPAGVKWREFVLGYSVIYSKGQRTSINSFRDSEGRVVEVSEQGPGVKLVVEIDIADCCYGVKGGKARYALDLKMEPVSGDACDHPDSGTGRMKARLTGTMTGEMNREDCKVAGPGGKLPCKGNVTGSLAVEPWPGPVAGFVPVKPNEHPRLVFRKPELDAIKKRAGTPEGKAIITRIQLALDGPVSLNHGTGYGFLWQLTGDKQYAEKAKEFLERAMHGIRDTGTEYAFPVCSNKMRAGPSAACVACCYDLCFDALEPDFRKAVAKKIQDVVYPGLIYETGGGQHNPHSNHYGCWKGGAGVALLGITGDDGIDQEAVSRSLRHIEGCMRRALKVGYTERAYFYEGTYCGRIAANTGLMQCLQAARVAAGEDWITDCQSAQWQLTKWIFELYRRGPEIRSHMEGMYARPWGRSSNWSGGGDFCQGFGILPEAHKPAVLWFYNRVLEPGAKTYDIYASAQRGVYAFVNWPLGLKPRDPAEAIGVAMWDRTRNRAIVRGSWNGSNDVVCFMFGGVTVRAPGVETSFPGMSATTTYFKDEPGTRVCLASSERAAMAFDFTGTCGAPALLVRVERPQPQTLPEGMSPEDAAKLFKAPTPAAGRIIEGGRKGMVDAPAVKPSKPSKPSKDDEPPDAVDPTGDVVADKLIPHNARRTDVDFGTLIYSVLTVQPGDAPRIAAEGEGNNGRLKIGKRAVRFDGEKIVLE